MNNMIVENEKYFIEIVQDESSEDPRQMFDHMCTMLCGHRDYILGDKTEINMKHFDNANDLEQYLYKNEGALVVQPLYLLDHSGLTIRTSRFLEDPQGWDTSFIGFIYVTRESLKNFWNKTNLTKSAREIIQNAIECEIAEYNQYLSGDVYGYKMYEKKKCQYGQHLEEIDSCWGFYGMDSIESEAKALIGEQQ